MVAVNAYMCGTRGSCVLASACDVIEMIGEKCSWSV